MIDSSVVSIVGVTFGWLPRDGQFHYELMLRECGG